MPVKLASMPRLLSLSHSSPRPLAGAGAFCTPVLVWPNRTTVHVPAGTSQTRRPSAFMAALRSTMPSRAMIISDGNAFSAAGPTPPVW